MKNRKGRIIVLFMGVLVLSYSVGFATLIENETSTVKGNNDTREDADPIVPGPAVWADAGVMHLASGGGDVDFFSIALKEGEILMAATTPLADLFVVPNTILGLFDEVGALLALNDNAGSSDPDDYGFNLGSKIEFQAPEGATYFIGVTGWDDFDFDGYSDNNNDMQLNGDPPHDQSGAYVLTVTVIPEPATFMLLLLGAMLFLRKRIVFQS